MDSLLLQFRALSLPFEEKDIKNSLADDGAGKPIEKSVKFSWGEEEESDSDGEYKTAGKEIRYVL